MDKYTCKFFFEEIRQILDARPIDEIRPVFIYRASDGIVTALDKSGNKIIGDIEDMVFAMVEGCPSND